MENRSNRTPSRRDFLRFSLRVGIPAGLVTLASCGRGRSIPTDFPETGTPTQDFQATAQVLENELKLQKTVINLVQTQRSVFETQTGIKLTESAFGKIQTENAAIATSLVMATVSSPDLETPMVPSTPTPTKTPEPLIIAITDNEAVVLAELSDALKDRYGSEVLVRTFPSCGDLMDSLGYKEVKVGILDNLTGSEPSGIACTKDLAVDGIKVVGHDHSRSQNLIMWRLAGADTACQKGDDSCIYEFLEDNFGLTPKKPD